MKYNINNGLSLVCIILILILVLCFLRYYSLKKEQFENHNNDDESLFNNELTKEFERKFDYRHDCSGGAFKKKMLDYFGPNGKFTRNGYTLPQAYGSYLQHLKDEGITDQENTSLQESYGLSRASLYRRRYGRY